MAQRFIAVLHTWDSGAGITLHHTVEQARAKVTALLTDHYNGDPDPTEMAQAQAMQPGYAGAEFNDTEELCLSEDGVTIAMLYCDPPQG